MTLQRAIDQLAEEVAAFKQGTADQPKENSPEWYLLRAKSLGLSHLKLMKQLGTDDAGQIEQFHRQASRKLKHEDA